MHSTMIHDPKTPAELARMERAYEAIRALGFTPLTEGAFIDADGAARCWSVECWRDGAYAASKAAVTVYADGKVSVRGATVSD